MARKWHTSRSREKIIAEILSSLREPIIRTQLMYKARVSNTQLRLYMRYLEEREMIQRLGNGLWVITDLGRGYLDQFRVIEEIMTE